MNKPQEMIRCSWADRTPLETIYHDTEWGRPLHEERRLFEKLILESMQTGISWSVILNKRENFRVAFDQFDPEKIALYDDKIIAELLENPGIVRNRRKILSVIGNAKAYLAMAAVGETLNQFFWGYLDGKPLINHWAAIEEVPANTPLSAQIAADLKKRGFTYVGPTTIYALMQSSGMVNDHLTSCDFWQEITNLSQPKGS